MVKRKRGAWVVEAVAGPSFINHGLRHFKYGLSKAEAKALEKKWAKMYPSLNIIAVRWEG